MGRDAGSTRAWSCVRTERDGLLRAAQIAHLMSRGCPERGAPTQGNSAVQFAHVGWSWVDEIRAVLAQEQRTHGSDPKDWQSCADVSFGAPDVWQLSSAASTYPRRGGPAHLRSAGFWPMNPEECRESYLLTQLGLFETATTNEHVAEEGSPERQQFRRGVFYDNAWDQWCAAVCEPQAPRGAQTPVDTPAAAAGPRSA
jgi:hypothetical protein